MQSRFPRSRWPAAVLVTILLGLASTGCGSRQAGLEPHEAPGEPLALPAVVAASDPTVHWQGEMAGEVTDGSVILQARLTRSRRVWLGNVRGQPGVGLFAVATDPSFTDFRVTDLSVASAGNDYPIKVRVGGLQLGTRY